MIILKMSRQQDWLDWKTWVPRTWVPRLKDTRGESSPQVSTVTSPKDESSQEPTPTPPGKEPEGDKEDTMITEVRKGVYMIYPGALDIAFSDNKRYWILSADKKYAELRLVCWLQVTGSIKVKRGKSYDIKFNISFTPDAFGWNGLPLFMMAKIGENGSRTWKRIKPLKQPQEQIRPQEQTTSDNFDIPNPEEKFEVKIADDKGDKEPKLFFGLYEIWSNKWKGGLRINHATVEEVN